MVASLKTLANSLSSFPPENLDVTVETDDTISEARIVSYPKDVLYFMASFIAVVCISHFFSLCYRYTIRTRASMAQLRTSISALRLPTAFVDSLRALVFRWTIPLGSSFTLSLAGLGLALGYICVLFSCTFVDSMFLAIYRLRISVHNW